MLSSGFYPVLAVLVVASFVPMLYDHVEWTFSRCLIHAAAEFTGFFSAFYIAGFAMGSIYKELTKSNSSSIRLNNYIAYNLMYVMAVEILNNFVAYLFPPLLFMFMYTPVIAVKGTEYLGVNDQKKTLNVGVIASLLLVGIPFIIRVLLEMMINTGA
ncbi:MAG: hypothetical protein Q4B68_08385 [Bacteroidales bacterium]|nr:hypothetical protein [Bacteroidales bacterium]